MRVGWIMVAVAVVVILIVGRCVLSTKEMFVGADVAAADVNWDDVCRRINEPDGSAAFAAAYAAAGRPVCVLPNAAQATYDYNNCKLTTVMMSSVIGSTPYLEQARAFCGARAQKAAGKYMDTYTDLLKKFINYETASYGVYNRLNTTAPTSYTFIVPDPLDDADYAAESMKTWTAAASGAAVRSYKCVPFSGDERAALDYFKNRPLGTEAQNGELRAVAARGICVSKGYTVPVKGVTLGCELCDGCCMASSEPLEGVAGGAGGSDAGAAKCPPPKVRPFVIKKGATKIARAPPTEECFIDAVAPLKNDIKTIKQTADMRKRDALRNVWL